MPVFSVAFFRWVNPDTEPSTLAAEYHFPELYFWQKGSAKEICVFAGREILARLSPGTVKSLMYKEFLCHACILTVESGLHLGSVVMTDKDYPANAVRSFVMKATDLFLTSNPVSELRQYQGKDVTLSVAGLHELLLRYQDPEQADPIMKLQKQLDETKQVLFETMESLLRRGEKLEDLTERSRDLSFKSKAFLNDAEALNSCKCILF